MSQPTITPEEEARYVELQHKALDLARDGETNALKLMIDAGLPPNLADEKGQSLIMLASYHGHLETTRMLLDAGADPDQRNDRGQTPLGGVCFKGYLLLVELFVERGADIHADNGGGMTPIRLAAMFGRQDVVEYLQSQGAKLSPLGKLIGLPAYMGSLFKGKQPA